MNPNRGPLLKPGERTKLSVVPSSTPSNKLTDPEKKKLKKLEAIIETPGLAVSYALRAIRDERLYRQGFGTFEDYCQKRWGFSRPRAYQLLAALDVIEKLPPEMSTIVDKEGQARALGQVPVEQRAEVLQQASRNGKPTAKRITEAAKQINEPEQLCDHFGRVVPKDMIEDWQRAESVGKRLRGLASDIKSTIAEGFAGPKQDKVKDVIYVEIGNGIISDAAALFYALNSIVPYALCPICQGKNRQSCALCKRRGWVSKFLWNSPAVNEKTRKIIEGK